MLRHSWARRGAVQRSKCAIMALVIVTLVTGLWHSHDNVYIQLQRHTSMVYQPRLSPREIAANSTLGFQKLLVLSRRPGWRTRGLEAAARLTGLEFTIPPQGQNSDDLIRAFQNISVDRDAKRPAYGSAKAWLSHIDLLKHIVASDLETAFIVEDDVDWDVRIKSEMSLISDNVRAFTGVAENDMMPYGDDWDVLWLGHCGSAITNDMGEPRIYADDSRCETELYSGWAKHFLKDNLTEGHRQIQLSTWTVCTFGFGVTKRGARRIIPLLSKGDDEAYDIALSRYCREQKLRCIVVTPQLFNHYEPPSDLGYSSEVRVGDGKGQMNSDLNYEKAMGTTGNIIKSARCEALFHSTCLGPP